MLLRAMLLLALLLGLVILFLRQIVTSPRL